MTPEQLKQARQKLNLTQAELADRLGLTRDAISSMEIGRRPIERVTELAVAHLSCGKRHRQNR